MVEVDVTPEQIAVGLSFAERYCLIIATPCFALPPPGYAKISKRLTVKIRGTLLDCKWDLASCRYKFRLTKDGAAVRKILEAGDK